LLPPSSRICRLISLPNSVGIGPVNAKQGRCYY
jgi:hypothetical protein